MIGLRATRVYFLFIILGQDTNPSPTAKNIGIVFFDSGLNFCSYLFLDHTKHILLALVSNKLDLL